MINETISKFVMMHRNIVRHTPKIPTLLVKQLENDDTSSLTTRMKLVTWHIYISYWIPQQEVILLHSFTHTLSRRFIDFIIPDNMGYHSIQHVRTQGCNPRCEVMLLKGNFQLIPQQGVPNVSTAIVGSFAWRL